MENQILKINNGFILREVKGAEGKVSNVVITVGEASKKLNGMITLNETCAFIWKILENGATKEQIIDEVTKAYEVSADEVKGDVEEILAQFKKIGVIN